MGYKYMPSSFSILCSVFTFGVFIVDILWNCGVDFYKEGESLPLAPKQVAAQIALASSVDLLRFVACPLPLLLGLRPKTRMKNINDAKHKIQKKGKPVTHDRIVSELTFGFWTSLLTPRYSQASFQSKIIKTCFKCVPAAQRNIKNLQTRFDKIRILRNRVSHHERIIHWKNLSIQHDELLESIKWLDNASYELACSCDKFPKVYAKDFKAYKQYVKRHWNKYVKKIVSTID